MYLRALIAAALLVVPAQDGPDDKTLQTWVSQLDGKDPLEALSARDKLVHLGGQKALPFLKSNHGALKVEIEVNQKLGDRYGPPKFITLDIKNDLASNVFAELGAQSGEKFNFSRLDTSARLSIRLDKVSYWTALEQVCRNSIHNRSPWPWAPDQSCKILGGGVGGYRETLV